MIFLDKGIKNAPQKREKQQQKLQFFLEEGKGGTTHNK